MTWGISNLYIIEAQNGLAKIGCSYEPQQRFLSVRCHSPIPARLVAVWKGSPKQERALHTRFKKQRSHSEWFLIDGEFKEFLESKRGTGIVGAIADWPTVGEWNANRKPLESRQKLSRSLFQKSRPELFR